MLVDIWTTVSNNRKNCLVSVTDCEAKRGAALMMLDIPEVRSLTDVAGLMRQQTVFGQG